MNSFKILGFLFLVPLAACSSIIEGRHQRLAVETVPAGADCLLEREGDVLGRINPTPGNVKIEKTRQDIQVTCSLEGFDPVVYVNRSDIAAATFGNAVVGGLPGWGVDAGLGADNMYNAYIRVDMKTGKVTVFDPNRAEPGDKDPYIRH